MEKKEDCKAEKKMSEEITVAIIQSAHGKPADIVLLGIFFAMAHITSQMTETADWKTARELIHGVAEECEAVMIEVNERFREEAATAKRQQEAAKNN